MQWAWGKDKAEILSWGCLDSNVNVFDMEHKNRKTAETGEIAHSQFPATKPLHTNWMNENVCQCQKPVPFQQMTVTMEILLRREEI